MPLQTLYLAALLAVSAATPAPPATLRDPTLVAGCYVLALGSWHPDLDLGPAKAFIIPPNRVEVRAAPGESGWAKDHYALVPVPGHTSLHSGLFWDFTRKGTIHVVFTTGHAGLTMDLSLARNNLVGSAQTFWDFTRPVQTTTVNAIREPCGRPSSHKP